MADISKEQWLVLMAYVIDQKYELKTSLCENLISLEAICKKNILECAAKARKNYPNLSTDEILRIVEKNVKGDYDLFKAIVLFAPSENVGDFDIIISLISAAVGFSLKEFATQCAKTKVYADDFLKGKGDSWETAKYDDNSRPMHDFALKYGTKGKRDENGNMMRDKDGKLIGQDSYIRYIFVLVRWLGQLIQYLLQPKFDFISFGKVGRYAKIFSYYRLQRYLIGDISLDPEIFTKRDIKKIAHDDILRSTFIENYGASITRDEYRNMYMKEGLVDKAYGGIDPRINLNILDARLAYMWNQSPGDYSTSTKFTFSKSIIDDFTKEDEKGSFRHQYYKDNERRYRELLKTPLERKEPIIPIH